MSENENISKNSQEKAKETKNFFKKCKSATFQIDGQTYTIGMKWKGQIFEILMRKTFKCLLLMFFFFKLNFEASCSLINVMVVIDESSSFKGRFNGLLLIWIIPTEGGKVSEKF